MKEKPRPTVESIMRKQKRQRTVFRVLLILLLILLCIFIGWFIGTLGEESPSHVQRSHSCGLFRT